MQLRGQLRIGYLIQVITIVLVFIVPIVILLQDDGTNSVLNRNRYWFGIIGFAWLFGGAFFFLVRSVYTVEIDNEGIGFTSLLGKKLKYKFDDVVGIKSKSTSLKRRYFPSTGYQIITLEFADGNSMEISANTYSNFEKMKMELYRYTNEKHNCA